MAETTIVPENSSVPQSNNKSHDSNKNISDNSQFKIESTSISNNNNESSKTPIQIQIQINHSTTNQLSNERSNATSSLSMHDTQTTKRSNSNHFHSNSNYQYRNKTPSSSHFTSHINQPEAQAQLVAFTPPLMSIQLPHQEAQTRQRNYHSIRPYMQNQQSSFPMKSKSETAVQPEYYVDSFASNFSDKPSSNSNNKTKTKHVTFQEPDMTNESSKTNSNTTTCPPSLSNGSNYPSSTWTSPVPMYGNSRPFYRYNDPNYYYNNYNEFYPPYHNMMMNPIFMARPRGMNMMSTPPVWPSQSYYPNQQIPYVQHTSPPRQLYDPNKPKVPSTSESHDLSKVIRHIPPKNKKKTKQTNSSENSTVSTPEPVPHPITILRKPSTDPEATTPLIEHQPVFSPAEDEQQQSITSSDVPSKEEQPVISSNVPSKEEQPVTSSDVPFEEEQPVTLLNVPSEEEQPVTSLNVPSEEEQPVTSSDVPSEEKQPVTSSDVLSEEEQPITSSDVPSITDQSDPHSTISLPRHELLSILQSANCIPSLNEYAQQKKFPLNYEFSSISSSSFTCVISINGRQFPASSPCLSKNEAQKLACDQALRILYRESCANEQSSLEFSNKHDYIADRSISTFQELNVSELLLGRKTLACMLMVTDQQFEQARVISIATGNTCLDETNLIYADDGTALHDCHAEILARRGLIKFFFEQIKQSKDNKSSIFEYNSTINKYQLHENITFHMYISSLPCGNASLNISSNSIRYKQGQTEGTLLASTSSTKYPIKSCSDKICRWNILGIQGGLLINFLTKPIYLETITISCETTFDRNHVKYSLCEHLKTYFPSLSSPFLFHIPDIDCPKMKSFQQERQVAKLQTNAFAWNITQPDRIELLEPMTGRLKNDRSISLLSKKNFFEDFTNILPDNSLTYQQAKQLNKTYIMVKNLISTAFQTESSDMNLSWLSKSDQLEQFSIQ